MLLLSLPCVSRDNPFDDFGGRRSGNDGDPLDPAAPRHDVAGADDLA
jgi:hypothetical protein